MKSNIITIIFILLCLGLFSQHNKNTKNHSKSALSHLPDKKFITKADALKGEKFIRGASGSAVVIGGVLYFVDDGRHRNAGMGFMIIGSIVFTISLGNTKRLKRNTRH